MASKSQLPWTDDQGRELREAETGLSISVHRTVASATLAAMGRRWTQAALLLRIAATICDSLADASDALESERAAAESRSREALRGRPRPPKPRLLD